MKNGITKFFPLIFLIFPVTYMLFFGAGCKKEVNPLISTPEPPGPYDTLDAIILRSTDEGITWDTTIFKGPSVANLHSITGTNEGFLIAVGTGSFLSAFGTNSVTVKSTDFGNTWSLGTIFSYSFETNFRSVYSNLINSAVMLTPEAIFLTSNNGNNWDYTGSGNGMNSVRFSNASTGVMVGDLGVIMRTVNRGNNWSQVQSPVVSDLFDVTFHGTTGYAVGNLGTIIKTTDSGITWSIVPNESQSTLRGVSFYYDLYGIVAVGAGGTILRTFNAGFSWYLAKSGTSASLYDVAYSSGELVAVGTGGTIMRSTNLGDSWYQQQSNTNRDLNGVYASGTHWWVVGE
ncbi:MAG: hypothetical protein HOP31_09800 [Ignavibacteria bacterium]|nr:hypothetical protein [Ignavibacteria bacterium]